METQQSLQQQVLELEKQVCDLQRKLNDLHCTDLNSLKRAHTTLKQHVSALHVDSQHIANLVGQLETSLLTPTFVAQEVGIIASAMAGVWVLDRSFRMVRLPLSGMLTQAVAITALGALAWRLLRSSSTHVRNTLAKNKATKQKLQQDWEAVRRRVEIMVQLTAT